MSLPAIVLIAACVAATDAAADAAAMWPARVLIQSDRGLGGAAIGDLLPESAGNEVAAVDAGGAVWLARRSGDDWSAGVVHRGTGELIMGAIGDVDPHVPGNEFVGVGMVEGAESLTGPGHAVLLHRTGDDWHAREIFRDDHMLHGVAIGDVVPEHAGNEVVVCGFSHRVTLLRSTGEAWAPETIYVANDRLKIVQIGDVLPERPGNEVLVCGTDGQVVVLWRDRLGWKHEVVLADARGQSRIALSDGEVLIGGDAGKVTLARRVDGAWRTTFLFRDFAKMRGVVIADLDGSQSGSEYYACGYSGRVTQVCPQPDGCWLSRTIFTAERPLHHLLAGEVDAAHPGPELVTCGHGGTLYLIEPPPR